MLPAYKIGITYLDSSLVLSPWMPLVLVFIGFVVSAYGSMAGVGGAVLLLPVLLMLFPGARLEVITGISLAVVVISAVSGALAYAHQGRIDYRNGLLFAAATIPATVLGVLALQFVSVALFSVIFALLLLGLAAFILVRPADEGRERTGSGPACRLVDRSGQTFTWAFNRWLGAGLSMVIGFMAGLLGIGGGVIHVPVMVYVLCFPVHIATATSYFVLVFTALTGVVTHLVIGSYSSDWLIIFWLALGVLPGSQLGARLARRLRGKLVIKTLALALVVLGIRMLFEAF
jgi:uncharacterized protein